MEGVKKEKIGDRATDRPAAPSHDWDENEECGSKSSLCGEVDARTHQQ